MTEQSTVPERVGFNCPTLAGEEFALIRQALDMAHLSGNGHFTRQAQAVLEGRVGGGRALLTHSGTAALEMAVILAGVGPGDEVIMPSFTFTSTANAVALRGGVPVFVDIRPDTLNIDESLLEAAVTPRTRAICVVHYAGVAAQMDTIALIAERHGLTLIEDAAQALGSHWRGRPLGSFGSFAAFSFHETKNIIAGEGGALIVNDPAAVERAEIIWEKGTDRVRFQRGEVAKYTWMDIGSSYLPSEITAAFLLAQLRAAEAITAHRLEAWGRYHMALADLEAAGRLRRPVIPDDCTHNAHIYHVLVPEAGRRPTILRDLAARGIDAVSHYVPLHSSPAGRRFGRACGSMRWTDDLSARLLRLPLHPRLDAGAQARVVSALGEVLDG
ncbi:dTDP-4-amino-4,6-dideoxygalactose transaminase [Nitrospirillum iridis]|uniref:dTDP-4-amino-4,6-dideoxygalactose transaminase n=1 Tax=Nitrospirillum iridis TaxID=765888 RepID=A0A7X0B1R1_9PROT|nr:dTDP-4-amino-4,6-dideoxygalactose transaminase [Nitrospirillum iridis]MBB6253757.1 dTDP-4-amino-4,6-dideoxygalactose transaminase [Nitrospirillum iridis]